MKKKADRRREPEIVGSTRLTEIVVLVPGAVEILSAYELHCASCVWRTEETLEEGCLTHGFLPETTAELLDDLNRALEASPAREEMLTVTPAAVAGLRAIALQEKRAGQGLKVLTDEGGSFCLEFRSVPDTGDRTFAFKGKPPVSVFASPLVLRRIGGAVIDVREGGFKLDLPEDADLPLFCGSGACGCGLPE